MFHLKSVPLRSLLTLNITDMIRLNVFFEVKEEAKAAEICALCKELVEKSLNDEGNVAYDYFVSGTRKGVMMICETWRDEQALAAHSAAPHFALHVGNMEKLGKLKLEKFQF